LSFLAALMHSDLWKRKC